MILGNRIIETINAFLSNNETDKEIILSSSSGNNQSKRKSVSKKSAFGRIFTTIAIALVGGYLFYINPDSQIAATLYGAIAGYWLS